jgi:hypothetical protein
MLSRKTSNLGRVVDGEKNAGMNAQKSGQDELQSFFAETSVRDEKVSKTPVKGSILSYFGKQQNQKNQPNKALGSKIEIEGDAKESSKARSSIATKGILKNSRKIEWDCVACTLHNSQEQQHSDWLVCEICQTPYTNMIDVDANDSDLKNRLHQVTPASARKGNSNSLGNSNVDTQSIRRYETIMTLLLSNWTRVWKTQLFCAISLKKLLIRGKNRKQFIINFIQSWLRSINIQSLVETG